MYNLKLIMDNILITLEEINFATTGNKIILSSLALFQIFGVFKAMFDAFEINYVTVNFKNNLIIDINYSRK